MNEADSNMALALLVSIFAIQLKVHDLSLWYVLIPITLYIISDIASWGTGRR